MSFSKTNEKEEKSGISFNEERYSCFEGEIIDAFIKTNKTSGKITYDYRINNTEIATIIPDTISTKAIQISCIKSGLTSLNVTSSDGGTKTVPIIVNE